MEFVKRIAKSDDQMIDDLNDQLLKLNNDKAALEADKAQNEQSKAQLEQNKAQLNDAYSKSSATIAAQQKEIQDYQKNKARTSHAPAISSRRVSSPSARSNLF